jgi:aminoglycoside phosphotransferase family enzyme
LNHARRDPLDTSGDWTAFDRVLAADDTYFHVKRIDVEAQGNVCSLTRLDGQRLYGRLETLQLSDDRAVADRNVRKSELPRLVREIARFHAGARQQQRHAGHHHRLTIWRRQRHRARDDARR